MSDAIEPVIRTFIEENFLFRSGGEPIDSKASLLDAGIIDSTGVLELVSFIEETFGITVADAEIVPENLDSIEALVRYVSGKGVSAPVAA